MRKPPFALAFSALLAATASQAQGQDQNASSGISEDSTVVVIDDTGRFDDSRGQAGTAGDEDTAVSRATEAEVTGGPFRDEALSLRPAVGAVGFTDAGGSRTARGLAGLFLDFNLARALPDSARGLALGLQTGALYSHLGTAGSNFFGSAGDNGVGGGGSNFLLIPADLMVGLNIGPFGRIGAHGGINGTYRSEAGAMLVGESSAQAGSAWRIFPNVGADFDFSLSRNIGLEIRPDVTLTPGDDLYTGSAALVISLG